MGDHPVLLPAHRQTLENESAISPDVIAARGYRTVTRPAELLKLGFGPSQRNTPGLLMPVYAPNGDVALYLSRPDTPRIKNNKAIKYEIPGGARMSLDVPPGARANLRNPAVPLFITEGCKKADAAVSQGLCCIALIGVWNWRGTNEFGGKTVLPEWEDIALNERQVYICFDSDVTTKPEVYQALVRLKGFLGGRKAKVAIIYLPSGEGGAKVGLDDFFAAGHTKDDLLSHATNELRPPLPRAGGADTNTGNGSAYEEAPHGLVWHRRSGDGTVPTPLTNFTARIVGDVLENDGAETRRVFTLETRLNQHERRFDVPAPVFDAMNWPTEHLGAAAIVYPGQGIREHTRTAIKTLSRATEQHVRTHTGWIQPSGADWAYCHAGGLIGAGPAEDGVSVRVRLSGSLERYELPQPPASGSGDLVAAVRASLDLLDLGRDTVTFPVFAAIWRACLGTADFSLFLTGPTGVFKSELAALAQQHFGAGMNARHLPADWSATDNYLEGLAFNAKDALLVIDEYVPGRDPRLPLKADRVLRSQGNHAARGRMRADGTLRPPKPPRGLILSTGEDVPPGHSLRARNLVVEVAPGDLHKDRLSACQKDASAGSYARAMAGFLAWLAPQYGKESASLRESVAALRNRAAGEMGGGQAHGRTLEIIANLALGLKYFLRFACDAGALTKEKSESLFKRGWQVLKTAGEQQAGHQAEAEPTRRFLELLGAAIASGKAHVAAPSGTEPRNAPAWGWREHWAGAGENERREWRAQGERVGWVDGNDLYLNPEAAYQAAQRMADENSGAGLIVSAATLRKRLNEKNLLVTTDVDTKRGTLTVRRTLSGARPDVLHLRAASLVCEAPDQSDLSDPVNETEDEVKRK